MDLIRQLYFLLFEGVRSFWGLTCDFLGEKREIFLAEQMGRLFGTAVGKAWATSVEDKMRGSFDSARCAPLRMTVFFER